MVGSIEERGGWKWGKVMLMASLALNLAFVGMIAGAAYRFGGGKHHARSGQFGAPYIQALSHEERRDLRAALHPSEDTDAQETGSRRALYAQMSSLLRATPFDAAGVEAIVRQQHTAITAHIVTAQTLWLQQVSDMTLAERSDYADRLDDIIARGSRWRKDR
jgi:uncharacterized membrane protein